jgi:arylsulfatase A-like enzyme
MYDRPNIVFFVSDQFRKSAAHFWTRTAYAHHLTGAADPAVTPNIDRLAGESLVLANAVSAFPLCSPYRGMMLTGMYPEKNGVVLNCNSSRPCSQLREDVDCISDILRRGGYSLGYIGKLHTDFPTPNVPQTGGYAEAPREGGIVWDAYTPPGRRRHGFDFWYSYGAGNAHKAPHYWDSSGDLHEPQQWSADHEAKIAHGYICNARGQRDPARPFALWVSTNPPHSPYGSLDDCVESDYQIYADTRIEDLRTRENAPLDDETVQANLRYYLAAVSGVDRAVGVVLEALDSTGLTENTIFVFTSDHGDSMGSHGLPPKNHPYNESVEVPFLLRYPGRVTPGADELMFGPCDIMPTLLGLCGLDQEIPVRVDGTNFAPRFTEAANVDDPGAVLLFRNVNGETDETGAVIDYRTDYLGVKTPRFTLCLGDGGSKPFDLPVLFDNRDDPYQMNNLFHERPGLVRSLTRTTRELIPADYPLEKLDTAVRDLLERE